MLPVLIRWTFDYSCWRIIPEIISKSHTSLAEEPLLIRGLSPSRSVIPGDKSLLRGATPHIDQQRYSLAFESVNLVHFAYLCH